MPARGSKSHRPATRPPRAKNAKKKATKRNATRQSSKRSAGGKAHRWESLPDHRLLDTRLRDLNLRIEGTPMEARIERVYEELDARGIRVRPHTWLSTEWFSPDGIPGVGVPFYLAHPRLVKLERDKMFEVEGASLAECMRILRHEMGHAVCTAYRLHRKPSFRKVFGSYSKPYPESYRPNPSSRAFVLHLDWWYAQAHPAEDFAETFAVWLKPGSKWRTQYKGWPALKKLEYMDELMKGIRDKAPLVRSKATVEAASRDSITLRKYYARKQAFYSQETGDVLEKDLHRIFSNDPAFRRNLSAAAFLRAERAHIRRTVADWTGQFQYTIDQVLSDIIERSRQLNLRLALSEEEARVHAMLMVAVHTLSSLKHRISL
ncbi:MAG: putative zinc-binding metallopeptidase [Polyangiales bacterium]|nr:putative zinc-binding metallopeptidase [Myxococcales bacterium]